MYKFHNQLLPSVFDTFFNSGSKIQVVLQNNLCYSNSRNKLWNFQQRFQGTKVWNDISDDIKLLPLKHFKEKLKSNIIVNY